MAQKSQVLAEDPLSDLEIAEAMTAELEDYIIKDELYRTVFAPTSRGEERLLMTGGDLLTRLHRLGGERDQLSPEMQQRVDAVQQGADSIIYSLNTRFNERLQRELKARLDSLKWYVDDCAGDPARCRANFPYEIRNRQRVEEILKRIGDDLPDDLRAYLQSVDHRIRQLTHGTSFIWDEQLKPIFPPSPYWYLYVSP